MHYKKIHPAIFCSRPNRFVARVELEGAETTCHVKNTGRCRELLVPGAVVYLEESENPARKTKYDLVAVEKGARVMCGGRKHRLGGNFYEPTVLTNVSRDMKVFREESFAPIAPM